MAAAKKDPCRFCRAPVRAVVRTAGGFSRVCLDCVDRVPNAVSVTVLPDEANVDLAWTTCQNMAPGEWRARLDAILQEVAA